MRLHPLASFAFVSMLAATTACGDGSAPAAGTGGAGGMVVGGSGGGAGGRGGMGGLAGGGRGGGGVGGTGGETKSDAGVQDAAVDAPTDANVVGMDAAQDGAVDASDAAVAVNECAASVSPCDANATCTDLAVGFACTCKTGFTGNGTTCNDVNECETNNGGCSADAVCSNTAGGRVCTCKAGFTGDGVTCADVDECQSNNGGCDALVTCTNTSGSHTCGNCPAGYNGGGATGCTDIDECTVGPANCSADATCTNAAGTFGCTCKAGFYGDGVMCQACSTCGAGKYQASACTSTTDTVCGSCSAGCATCTNDNTCTACTAGFYLSNGACVACSTCGAGQYQTAACGATTDTVCATCSACGAGQYQTAACGVATNTACGACDAGCNACTGPGACTSCAADHVLWNGTCVAVQGTSCRAIHQANSALPDGVYGLDPDGAGTGAPFVVFCDMTNDGGGWMKILQYHDQAYTPTAAAVGNVAVAGTAAMAKLADADVNKLALLANAREYRIQGGTSTKKLFIKSSATWDDTARGHGLVLTSTTSACEATTNCSYVVVTSPRPSIDSNDWSPSSIGSANNQDRYFTDYSANIHCYATSDSTKRCYGSGVTTGHAIINDLSIWVREMPFANEPFITYALNEASGTAVVDSSGNARGATLVSGSWTSSGHTGNALLGAARTDADVPVKTAVTVSLWVRRDGAGNAYPRILSWANDALELADYDHSDKLGVYLPGLGWQSTGTAFGSGYHHVAVTVGGGTVKVYFDGTETFSAAATANLNGKMSLGTRWNNVESWVGAIDQVRVYDRVLTAAEVATLAQE